MADGSRFVLLGLRFADNSATNIRCSAGAWDAVCNSNLGDWALQGFVGELASSAGLNLTNNMVKECKPGGFADLPEEGTLYQYQYQTVSSEPQPDPEPASPPVMDSQATSDTLTKKDGAAYVWSHGAILMLLDEFKERKWMLDDPAQKQAKLWREVAAALNAKGHHVTSELAKKKWNNMKQRFKIINDLNGKTGRGRSSWAYYDLMQDILKGDASVTPRVTVSSMGGTTIHKQDDEDEEAQATPSTPPTPSTSAASALPQLAYTPKSKRKRDRRNEAPIWYKTAQNKSHDILERLANAAERKNELLDRKNKLLEDILKKLPTD